MSGHPRVANGREHDGADPLEGLRVHLADRLRTRREEIEQAIFERLLDLGFDATGGEDLEYLSGARAAVAEAVDYGLNGIEQGDGWLGTIPPATAEQARLAARSGVSLERILLRNNNGHMLFEDFVVQEAEESEVPTTGGALRHILRTQGALLSHFTASIAHEYQHELELVANSPETRRMERVRRLLAGGSADAADLGYEFEACHLGVIAMGPKANETTRRLATGLGRQLLSVSRSSETVWAWLGGRQETSIEEIERLVPPGGEAGVSLVIGSPATGLAGWRLTHRQAQAAMVVALRQPRRITCYTDVALLAGVLRDRELARSLVEIHLSPLNSHKDGATWRKTLRAYFTAGCNAATAAAALKVDRHTVERRLHAIETRLGRLLRECHAELEVALRLDELGDADQLDGSAPAPTGK